MTYKIQLTLPPVEISHFESEQHLKDWLAGDYVQSQPMHELIIREYMLGEIKEKDVEYKTEFVSNED